MYEGLPMGDADSTVGKFAHHERRADAARAVSSDDQPDGSSDSQAHTAAPALHETAHPCMRMQACAHRDGLPLGMQGHAGSSEDATLPVRTCHGRSMHASRSCRNSYT